MSVISAPELLRTPRGYPPEWQRIFEALTAPINLVREIATVASANAFVDRSGGKKALEPRLSTDEILGFREQAIAARKQLDDVLHEIEGVAEKTWRAGREIRAITDHTLYPLIDELNTLDRIISRFYRTAEYARIISTVIEQSQRLLPIPLLEALRDAIAAEKAISLSVKSPDQTSESIAPASSSENRQGPKKQKRSTERGEGRAKLVAALTKHHQYADGGCLNMEPIGNNELAKAAGVSPSTASVFFNDNFHGHTKYKALCRNVPRLVAALKLLNDEFVPYHLLGAAPSDLAASEKEDTDAK